MQMKKKRRKKTDTNEMFEFKGWGRWGAVYFTDKKLSRNFCVGQVDSVIDKTKENVSFFVVK